MTDAERINFMQGQIQALMAFNLAVIETHPNLADLISHATMYLEGALAKISGDTVPEPFVDGVQEAKKRLLDYAASAAARRGLT